MRQEVARLVDHLDAQLRVGDADVHVHREDQQLADDVLQLVLEQLVALQLGDPLVLPAGERVGAGGDEPQPVAGQQAAQRAAQPHHLLARLRGVPADLRADLDDRLHHLGFDVVAEHRLRDPEQRVDVRLEFAGPVDDLELLLDADREIAFRVDADAHGPPPVRTRCRRRAPRTVPLAGAGTPRGRPPVPTVALPWTGGSRFAPAAGSPPRPAEDHSLRQPVRRVGAGRGDRGLRRAEAVRLPRAGDLLHRRVPTSPPVRFQGPLVRRHRDDVRRHRRRRNGAGAVPQGLHAIAAAVDLAPRTGRTGRRRRPPGRGTRALAGHRGASAGLGLHPVRGGRALRGPVPLRLHRGGTAGDVGRATLGTAGPVRREDPRSGAGPAAGDRAGGRAGRAAEPLNAGPAAPSPAPSAGSGVRRPERAAARRAAQTAPTRVVAVDLAGRFDLAAPPAGRGAALLDELLEPLQVPLHAALDDVQHVAHLLDDTFGLELQPHRQTGPPGVHRVGEEHHHNVALGPPDRTPRDLLVGLLVDDLRVPFAGDAENAGLPVQPLVVELADLLDALHELRELLELGPLVVGRGHRDLDVDRLLAGAHGCVVLSSPGFVGRGRVVVPPLAGVHVPRVDMTT